MCRQFAASREVQFPLWMTKHSRLAQLWRRILMRLQGHAFLHRTAAAVSAAGLTVLLVSLGLAQEVGTSATAHAASVEGWPGHARDPQHTALSSVAAQPLTRIHWKAKDDLHPLRLTIGDPGRHGNRSRQDRSQ